MGTFKFRSYHQDFWAGLMFLGLGLLAVYVARDYPIGRAMRMGPGYFPTYLGMLLTFIGAIVAGRSFFTEPTDEERTTRWAMVPLTLMPLSVILFAVVVDNFGLVLAVALLIGFASASVKNFKPIELIVMYGVLVATAILVFQKGLGVPFHAFWEESFGKAVSDFWSTISTPLRLMFGS
ncbi:MAG: tripartite tricarboxylate transporter TctB family protein [Proteobacteria bacterium]|nr:tripartite tricarboxylate transporter TctB family protein [Burkholderiales bacterium]